MDRLTPKSPDSAFSIDDVPVELRKLEKLFLPPTDDITGGGQQPSLTIVLVKCCFPSLATRWFARTFSDSIKSLCSRPDRTPLTFVSATAWAGACLVCDTHSLLTQSYLRQQVRCGTWPTLTKYPLCWDSVQYLSVGLFCQVIPAKYHLRNKLSGSNITKHHSEVQIITLKQETI